MNFISFDKWILTAPDWLQGTSEGLQKFVYQVWQTFVCDNRWQLFAKGLKITFIVTIGALVLGIIIGLVLAVVRTLYNSYTATKPPVVLRFFNTLTNIYLTVIRGTPMMVQLLIMGFVIIVPKTETESIFCGILALGINSGAYVAEIIRSGLMSIDKGQTEAGRSLGFNYIQTMWYVVIPQAIKNILPALGNEMITLLKDTSLVSVIALRDVTKQAQNIQSVTYQALIPYLSLALIYLVIVLILTRLLNLLEKRLRQSDH